MKRLAIILVLGVLFLHPVDARAVLVNVTIDGGNDGSIEFTTVGATSPVRIANSFTGIANYGGFVISDLGATATTRARVEAVDGSTDKLNLTGLRITNNTGGTNSIVITYSATFTSNGVDGFVGQQLAGAFSAANASNTIASRAWTQTVGCEFFCENFIDAIALRTPEGQLSAGNTTSFGGTGLRETESRLSCGTGGCYQIFGSTTVTLRNGDFVNLSGSHDIEFAETLAQLESDFDTHLAAEHQVPEPSSLYLLLAGVAPLGYFISRKRKP